MSIQSVSHLVADRIRTLRAARRWSARQLAEACAREGMPSLSRSVISKIESGARKVTADELVGLSRALGVSPDELVQAETTTKDYNSPATLAHNAPSLWPTVALEHVAGLEIVPTPPVGRSQHCVLFAVDIVRFTDAAGDDEVQLALREALYRLLIESFDGSGIPWRSCIHEDRGDGVVVVIPAHMPTITVVHPLVDQIHMRLRRHNRLSSPVAQVRLRLAVHIGEVYRDAHGLAGKAVNHLFRMLDAPNLRQALQSSELALIVSDYMYESVIHDAPNGVDPTAYYEVTVRVKQFQARAWILNALNVVRGKAIAPPA